MEEAPVWAGLDFIDHVGFEINIERARHVFARGRFGEEGAEATIVGGGGPIQQAPIRLIQSKVVRNCGQEKDATTELTLRPCSTV